MTVNSLVLIQAVFGQVNLLSLFIILMYINLYFLLSLQTSVSLNRLQKFLNNKELDEDAVIKKEDCSKYMFFTCHVQCTPVNHYLLLI